MCETKDFVYVFKAYDYLYMKPFLSICKLKKFNINLALYSYILNFESLNLSTPH